MSDKAYVAGVHMVKFAKPGQNEPYRVMASKAINGALEDAGIGPEHVQQAFASYIYGFTGSGQHALYDAFQTGIPLVNVSNGAWIGGMFHIVPQALNNDGQLEMIIVDPVTRLRITSLIPKLVRGTHMQESEITHASVRDLTIEASEIMPSHLDGEVGEPGTKFDIDILTDALELL